MGGGGVRRDRAHTQDNCQCPAGACCQLRMIMPAVSALCFGLEESPIVIAGRSHLDATGRNGQQIGVPKAF